MSHPHEALKKLSWATKSGRHIKSDRIPETIKDYLTAYSALNRFWGDIMGTGTPPPVLPQSQAMQARSSRGGGGSGGGGQSSGTGCCGSNAMWWWNDRELLDTGTPPGVPGAHMVDGNPAPLVNMIGNVYPNNNIIFDKGCAYFVPARNGVAQGQRKPLRCSQHTGGHGFGYVPGHPDPVPIMSQDEIDAKLEYRNLWHATNYAVDALNDMGQKGVLTTYSTGLARAYQGSVMGDISGDGGFRGGSGYCAGGNRSIRATFGGKSVIAVIDTGTVAILNHGSASCVFDPNPEAIQVPGAGSGVSPPGGGYYTPAYYISQQVKLCLTSRYTIAQSYGSGGTVSYDCQSGSITNGDVLGGKEWGGASTPVQMQVPGINPNIPKMAKSIPQPPGSRPSWMQQGYLDFGLGVI
jgi:hypothetical protein